jgi:uncharacterized protein
MKYLILTTSLLFTLNVNALNCNNIIIKDESKIKAQYNIDIAVTKQQQQKGLMYIKSMPKDYGMLFVWDKPKQIAMWMKNTYIPLDMLFINENNKIIGIIENTTPLSLDSLYIDKPIKQILEINANQAKINNFKINDSIECLN